MENFKNASRELYAKRPLFFNIGLFLSLSLCFVAFEYKVFITEEEQVKLTEDDQVFIVDDVLPTTQIPTPPPKKLPEPEGNINLVEVKEIEEPVQAQKLADPSEIEDIPFGEFKIPDEQVDDSKVYHSNLLEVNPEFEGGIDAFYEYISEALEYPQREQRMNIEGRVILTFIIEKDGSITEVEVLKGVSSGIDDEAKRVLNNSPNWEAGRQRGRAVRVRMNIPIYFSLEK